LADVLGLAKLRRAQAIDEPGVSRHKAPHPGFVQPSCEPEPARRTESPWLGGGCNQM